MFAHASVRRTARSYWAFVTTEPSPPPTGESDGDLAIRLAVEAGHRLVALRAEMFSAGAGSWEVMDTGDAVGHAYIAEQLRRHRPDDAVLDEEAAEDPRRFTADRVWIIDPLDGTREFGEHGRHDWAVHVALWGGTDFVTGAVSLPALDLVFATDPAPTLPPIERERPRLITSRYRAPYAAVIVANALECDAVRLGSAGAKAMAVVMGEADIYLHDGGMYQWDSAAPAAVALAAGLHVSRIDGSPIVYNDRDPWLPDLLICRRHLARASARCALGAADDEGETMELKTIRHETDGHVGDRVPRSAAPTQRVDRPHARGVPMGDARPRAARATFAPSSSPAPHRPSASVVTVTRSRNTPNEAGTTPGCLPNRRCPA